MVTLDLQSANLRVKSEGAPTQADVATQTLNFHGRWIIADGSVDLVGAPGENIGGWKLGYAQLEYAEGNFANYRGRTNADGSIHLSWSHGLVARDTDESAPSIFYDPPSGGITDKGRGTRVVPHGARMPASGRFRLNSVFADAPGQEYPASLKNPSARDQTNFLYHAYATFMFYTALIAQEPSGRFHILKHFYWNIRWDIRAEPAPPSSIRISSEHHMRLNIGTVHSGNANDGRFANRVLQPGLPVANNLAARRPHRENLAVWG